MTFWDWMTANETVLTSGPGLFSWLHFLLMFVMFSLIIAAFFIFKKYPVFARKFTFCIVVIMMASRVFRMVFRVAVGADSFWVALPWQLCHIMCFAIGILFLTKSKKLVTPIVIFSFFGGVLTFLFGDYYVYNVLTFYDIESILLHIYLPLIAVYFVATNQVEFSKKSLNQTIIFLLLLVSYAEIGNTIFGDTNIMFIRENALPFLILPGSHIHTYLLLVIIAFVCAYTVLYFKNKSKSNLNIDVANVSEVNNAEQIDKNCGDTETLLNENKSKLNIIKKSKKQKVLTKSKKSNKIK